jgi:hypothetical protein
MELKEPVNKELDVLGSDNTPLAPSASFVGPTTFYEGFHAVSGLCEADQDGVLMIEYSPDGTNWYGETSTQYIANDRLNFSVLITTPYWRIRFVNGINAQGSFNIYWYGVRSISGIL